MNFLILGDVPNDMEGIDPTIEGICCVYIRGQDFLVLIDHHHAELRDTDTGKRIDSLDIKEFTLSEGICQISPNTILVAGYKKKKGGGVQFSLLEIEVRRTKLKLLDKQLEVPNVVSALTCYTAEDDKLIIVVSLPNSVLAMEYESGKTVWELNDPKYDGKTVEPMGICSDGANHLFLLDYGVGDKRGNEKDGRVLVLNTKGEIVKKLWDIPSQGWAACWVPVQRKLVISNNYSMIYVHDIEYK